MSSTPLPELDVGLMGFIALGGGAVVLMAWQCLQMVVTIMNPPKEVSEATQTPAALPRDSSREKVAQKSDASMKLVAGDVEAGGGRVVFMPCKPKPGKAKSASRSLETPLVHGAEGAQSP